MSIMVLSERREDTVPPEHCSREKTLLHWPRCSVAPISLFVSSTSKRRGMALNVPNRLPVVHRQQEWKRIPLLLEAA